jgi:hypothetical protein
VIDDTELEDRLRRTFDAVADLPMPGEVEQPTLRREPTRRRALVTTVMACAVATLVVAVAFTITRRSSARHIVIASPTTTLLSPPAKVSGQEQTIKTAQPDPALQPGSRDLARAFGSPHTFVVNDGPDFALIDGTPT